MAAGEIGFPELRALVLRSWKLILGLALVPGILVFVWLFLVVPDIYSATASLVVHYMRNDDGTFGSVDVYKALLASESVIDQTRDRLVGEGTLAQDDRLRVGQNLRVGIDTGQPRISLLTRQIAESMAVLRLEALDDDPEAAAAIANVWAEVFVERSRSMTRGPTSGREPVLGEELPGIRQQLEQLEAEQSDVAEEYAKRLSRVIEQFQKREDETSTLWDRQIAETESNAETAVAEYYAATRRLMEEAVGRFVAEAPGETEAPIDLHPNLLEIVSVRAELARSPRVLRLEKAASDETLAELLMGGANAEGFDNTLVTQEVNPLYDQLAVALIGLEGALKRKAGTRLGAVSRTLGELEQTQLTRSAGLATLLGKSRLEPRSMHRQRGFALRTLARARKDALDEIEAEREATLAEIRRRFAQLADLERRIKEELNTAVLTGLFEQVDAVSLASRAVPHRVPEPRSLLMVAAVTFLGGLLGLMIALFRSAHDHPGQ